MAYELPFSYNYLYKILMMVAEVKPSLLELSTLLTYILATAT